MRIRCFMCAGSSSICLPLPGRTKKPTKSRRENAIPHIEFERTSSDGIIHFVSLQLSYLYRCDLVLPSPSSCWRLFVLSDFSRQVSQTDKKKRKGNPLNHIHTDACIHIHTSTRIEKRYDNDQREEDINSRLFPLIAMSVPPSPSPSPSSRFAPPTPQTPLTNANVNANGSASITKQPLGRMEQLELYNFKSYGGHHTIPFKAFSAGATQRHSDDRINRKGTDTR